MGKRRLVRAPSPKEERRGKSRWTTWAVVGGLVVVIGAIIAVVMLQSRSKAAGGVARVGRPAPDFTLHLFNGQSVTLASLKGKPVLINFWHSS